MAPLSEKVYDGEVIPLKTGGTLHVDAMRTGSKPAVIEYADGKAVIRQAERTSGR